MTPIILTGDSHLAAMKRGVDLLEEPRARSRFIFWPFGPATIARAAFHDRDQRDGTVTVAPARFSPVVFSQASLAVVGPDASLVISLPLHSARFLRFYSWETHVPWKRAREEVALSDKMVEEMIDEDCLHAVSFVRDVAQVLPKVHVLEAPRLFANSNLLEKSRLEVLLDLQEVYRDRVRAKLLKLGVPVIDQPSETITEDRMTDLAYDNENPDDQHHGNRAYGKLALEAVLRNVDAGSA